MSPPGSVFFRPTAEGRSARAIAEEVGCSRPNVYVWIRRFNEEGLAGLQERPRSGRPPTYSDEQRAEIVAAALAEPSRSAANWVAFLEHAEAWV